jgi:DNA polymerase III epsilon subunit-like protein
VKEQLVLGQFAVLDRPPWASAPLTALDLEGTGAQNRDYEAILEIAVVPLAGGRPDMAAAWESLVNPERPIPRRPWISPGLTDCVLAGAPSAAEVAPRLRAMVEGRYLVGHNIGVDARLLRRRRPDVRPAGLVDTLRLARQVDGTAPKSLGALVERHALADEPARLVPGGRPHRALFDAVAAALLLTALVRQRWERPPSLRVLLAAASPPDGSAAAGADDQPGLW